jgi:hypothetical protein
LIDLLVNENFQDDCLVIHLARDPALIGVQPKVDENGNEHFERKKLHEDVFSKFARDRANITDYGLKFFFEMCKDLVINQEVVEAWYKVIINITQTESKQIQEVPVMPEQDEEGNELSDEKRDEMQQRIDEVTEDNAKAIEFNNNLSKIKAKVKIVYQEMPAHKDEVALLRLNNYRELKPDESTFLGTSMDAGQTSAD